MRLANETGGSLSPVREDEFAHRRSFFGLTDADAALLQEFQLRLPEAAVSRFLDGFCQHLVNTPEAARIVGSSRQVQRLRQHQDDYFRSLLSGRYDAAYAQNRQRIGRVHQQLGLDSAWYLAAYGRYTQGLMELARPLYINESERFESLWQALNKIVLLDVSLVLEAYGAVGGQAARQRESRLRQAQRLASIGSWEWLAEARQVRFSAEAASLFGLPPSGEQLSGQRALELVHADDRAGLLAAVERAQADGVPFQLVHRIRRPSGETRYLKHYAEPVRDRDGSLGIQGAVQDITDQYLTQQQLDWMTRHDPLTGLMNMSSGMGALEALIADPRQQGQPFGVLLVGVDRMKRINDTFGRDVGDRLLRLAARRLQRAFPRHQLARVSGDEFLLLPQRRGDDPAAVKAHAARAADLFDSSVQIAGEEMPVSVSVGGMCAGARCRCARELLRGATSALYRAKDVGGRAWRLYDPALDSGRSGDLGLEARLRRALELAEFRLCYQPQYAVRSGALVGVEALLRWESPEGVHGPDTFVTALEESGLMVQVGQEVLRQACEQLAAWRAGGIPVPRVAVNISALQLSDPGFLDFVRRTLERFGVPPHCLELELTEHAVIQSPEDAGQKLRGLKALGVRVTMDDFGTGYSSLSYLKRLPVDQIKVDKSFISDLPDDESGAALTRAIIAMAHGLDLEVVAEGVETRQQLAFLERLDCDMVQGFLMGRPVSADRIRCLAWTLEKSLQD